MFKKKKILWLFVLVFSMITLTDCGTGQSNKEESNDKVNSEVNALLKEQNELYAKACEELSNINQKVIELNDKIHSMKGKLTDAQNKAIDEIIEKRTSINARMRQVKNVSGNDWENFKTTLEKDIDDMKIQIDEVLASIK